MKDIVYSFDVFDTSITRIWARPTHLFWKLGRQLQKENLICISPESWSQLRIASEDRARKLTSTGEVTLTEIYQHLALWLNWSDSEVKQAQQKEIELESSSLRPIPITQKRVHALERAGKRVIYISDMYLSETVIRDFLQQNQILKSHSSLYVSSEARVNKASGKLFQHCLLKESLQPSQLHHCGDNIHADINMSKRLGISSELFSPAHLNRYEAKIADTNRLPLEFRSLLAGTARLTRLQLSETNPHRQTIWDTTASVIAPTLFGFVHWCLVEAQKKGIQRLYFVARDGQILLKIARIICKNWGFTIDCRYLYGSRRAWHLPAIQEIGRDELEWMLFGNRVANRFLSIRSICDRVSIAPEQIQDTLSRYGFATEKWDLNLSQPDRDLLKQVFTEPDVTELIISTATRHRQQAIGYFCQEGLNDGVPFGYVDIGWTGNVQRSFSKLLSIANLYPESGVCGFYFALDRQVRTFQSDRSLAYFSADRWMNRFICQYRCLFELCVAADHGSTTGYEQYGGKYIPVLRSPKNKTAIDWGLYTMQGAVVKFAEQFTHILTQQECAIDLLLEASEILTKEFVLNPTRQEAQVFGSFIMSGDHTENAFNKLAPNYNFADWWKLIFFDRHPHADAWFPASLAKSHAIVRKLFWLKEANLIRKIRKISGLGKFKQKFFLQSQIN